MSKKGPPVKDLSGQKFNKWTVINISSIRKLPCGQTKTYWTCRCDCGKIKDVYSNSLISNKSLSCGCIKGRKKGDAACTNIYSNYRCKARRRNISFNLTEEEFKQITQKNCFYCNSIPANIANSYHGKGSYIYNGMDRVDNNKGYSIDNIVPCCKNCNLAKRQLTQFEFFGMIKMIFERHLNERT